MGGLAFTGLKTRGTGRPQQVESGFPGLLLTVLCKHSARLVQNLTKKPGQKHKCSIKVDETETVASMALCKSLINSWLCHWCLLNFDDRFCKLQAGRQNQPNSHKWSVKHDKNNPTPLYCRSQLVKESRSPEISKKQQNVTSHYCNYCNYETFLVGLWYLASREHRNGSVVTSIRREERHEAVCELPLTSSRFWFSPLSFRSGLTPVKLPPSSLSPK